MSTRTAAFLMAVAVVCAAPIGAATPPGLANDLETPPALVVDQGFDAEALRVEFSHDRALPVPDRFALPIELGLTPETAGEWSEMADGSRLWRLVLQAPGAVNLNLFFDRFDMLPGRRLWLYDGAGEQVFGPYGRNDGKEGEFVSPIIVGDTVVVELWTPVFVTGETGLSLKALNWGFRFFRRAARPGGQTGIVQHRRGVPSG